MSHVFAEQDPVATEGSARELVRSARSFLFVPGDRPDRFDKAAVCGADMVVLDLEDAVATERKTLAREAVGAWLTGGGRAAVRINAVDTEWFSADVAALRGLPGLFAVVVPKAESPGQVTSVWEQTGVPIVALVESAAGVLAAADLARSAGVIRLAFGHLDYAVDLDIEPTSPAMAHARSTLVVASRAHGLPGPVDGVTTALEDGDDLRTDLAYGRALGMTAKLLIHPKQVDHTHAAFAPTREQIEWAERVAHASGAGSATRLDGHMIDAPVLARALSILERAGGTPPYATRAGRPDEYHPGNGAA